MIHEIAGELGAVKPFHHGEVCGRLLFSFLDVLAESENADPQRLMAQLGQALLPEDPAPPTLALSGAWWPKDRPYNALNKLLAARELHHLKHRNLLRQLCGFITQGLGILRRLRRSHQVLLNAPLHLRNR